MRVLHLSWEYPPLVYGGLGRHVHALAEAQAGAGHDVAVVTQHPGTEGVAQDERVNGVRVVRAPYEPMRLTPEEFIGWTSGLNDALAAAALPLADTWRPEVVHGHDWIVAKAGVTLRDAFDLPLVGTVHATEAGRHQGWIPSGMSREIHRTEWRFTHDCSRVIACSEYMRWEVTRLFDLAADGVDVIPNGIDLSLWTADPAQVASARATYADGGPLVVFTGRLEWEKGVHTLIEAMPRLRRRFPHLRLAVVGRGAQAESLRALAARLRVSRSVSFTGWLTESELHAVTAAADVAVVPSVYEPFGLVALEAAALGTPLVVARTGGLAELVDHEVNGLVVPALDAAALADAISRLLHDEVLSRRLARRARAVAREHTWSAAADATVATYERAAADEPALRTARTTTPRRRPVVREGNLLRDPR